MTLPSQFVDFESFRPVAATAAPTVLDREIVLSSLSRANEASGIKAYRGWYFAPWANRHNNGHWRGPYRSEVSVAMMIARQLRREITARYQRQVHGSGP
jgi:hypothetical protein